MLLKTYEIRFSTVAPLLKILDITLHSRGEVFPPAPGNVNSSSAAVLLLPKTPVNQVKYSTSPFSSNSTNKLNKFPDWAVSGGSL